MAGRPGLDPTEEGKSYSALFVLLVAVLLVSAVWSIWDDNISRRPWKQYQVQWDHLAYDKYMQDAADEQKRLNADPTYRESRIEGPGRGAEAARLGRHGGEARGFARAAGRSQQHGERQRSAGAVHQVVPDRAMVRLQPRRSVQGRSDSVQTGNRQAECGAGAGKYRLRPGQGQSAGGEGSDRGAQLEGRHADRADEEADRQAR